MTKAEFMKKTILALFLVLLFVQTFSIGSFAARSKPDIEIEVIAGFNGVARLDSKVPFRISLHNKGAAFDGEVQVVQTNRDYFAAQVYAMPCSLPSGSKKELIMHVPIRTANRDVKISLAKGNKVIQTVEYKFNRITPPYTPVVGIISDDEGMAGKFNGIKINRTYQTADVNADVAAPPPYTKEKSNVYSYQDAWAMEIDYESIPDTLEGFSQFDVIVISNFDTGVLTAAQYEALTKWVDRGGIFLIAGGPNSRKTFGGLPEGLKPVVTAVEGLEVNPGFLQVLSDTAPPVGKVSISAINPGNGTTLLSDSGYPMVVSHSKGNGAVAHLAFDPGLEPVARWNGIKNMWQSIINQVYGTTAAGRIDGTLYNQQTPKLNLNYLASNVPESRTPPFKMLIVLIGSYILIVSPVIYLFLKWRDKRDWSWFIIPLTSLIFMGIIYLAGFKTRYNTAVLNNFSLIRLDFENDRIDADSFIGIFNNRKGKLKVAYDPELRLELSTGSDMGMYSNRYYGPGYNYKDSDVLIASKFTFSNPPTWEFYDTMLWEPRLVSVRKSGELKGGFIESVTIEDSRLKASIKNTSGMDFKEAFFVIGNTYIDLGDIRRDEEKTVNISLNGSEVSKGLSDFMDKRYGQPYYASSSKLPKDWREKHRKRNILDYVLSNINLVNTANPEIRFYAFNYDSLNYNIKVNDKDPEVFNTNLVSSQFGLMPEKGGRVTIPSGIIKPVLVQNINAFYEDTMNGTIRVQSDGDVNFRFRFPEGIRIDRLGIKWSIILPSYLKYQQKPGNTFSPETAGDNYKFYIYNVEKGRWEDTGEEKMLTGDLSQYVDSLGEVEVKANVVRNETKPSDELLQVPDIEISGVVE